MLKSYGGYTWTSEDPYPINSESHRAIGFAGLAVLGAGVGFGATRDLKNGYRGVDYIAASARLGGNLFPFQLGNTFRIPEILSPYLSNQYRAEGVENFGVWEKDVLSSDSTYSWLRNQTGLSHSEMRDRGITKGMLGTEDEVAERIAWTPTSGSKGRLESVMKNGDRRLISEHISLMATSEETINPLSGEKGLNKYASAVYSTANIGPGFDVNDVFNRSAEFSDGKLVNAGVKSPFVPVASFTGPMGSVDDLLRRTTLARGIPAFEMNRYNVLLENVVDQFAGDTGKKFFKNILKMGPGVKPGPASHMFARYGMAAAAVGGLYMGNEQLDWFRRDGAVGHVAASAIVGAGVGVVAGKLGAKSRTAFMAGMGTFFGQMVLPGFGEGLLPGLATVGVNADIMRANAANPFNYFRRTLEGFAPGISDWKTGALLSIGAITASSLTLPGMKERLNVKLARAVGKRMPVIGDNYGHEMMLQNKGLRDIYYENVGHQLGEAPENTYGFFKRKSLLNRYLGGGTDPLERTRSLNRLWSQSEEIHTLVKSNNALNKVLSDKLGTIASTHSGGGFSAFKREAYGVATEAYMNFLGADLQKSPELLEEVRNLGFGRRGPTTRMGRLATLGLAVFGAHQLLTGGLLGSMESSDDLRATYGGSKLVEMKKSRWWEGGGTPYEGGETSYFRPHAYALMMNRVHEKATWGENEDDRSPIRKFFTKNFTYDLEKEQYWDRPYPITNAAFSDVPIIGGILGASIGQVFKPPRLMHTGEWMREGANGNIEFASVFRGGFVEPSYELGAVGQGRPVSPFNTNILHSDLVSQFRELEGMTGWAKGVVAKGVFGSDTWATDQARLATSGEMTNWSNRFWEAELGGFGFANEFVRRIFPNASNEIKKYNPITNNMPSWLPDKFHYGDPYRSLASGESRLPGVGFAALHPELQGLESEAYPLLYKYQILSDVAPLTPEFTQIQNQMYLQRQQGQMTDREIAYLDSIDSNRAKVINKLSYRDAPEGAITLPGSILSRSLWQGGKQMVRDIAAPAEYLVPMGFRPVQKLMGSDRTAIERYEFERLYGTPLAFWDKPVRDWIRPSFYSALHLIGFDSKPAWRAEADANNAYFDKLKFVKYMGLADQATAAGDGRAAAQYRWQASQTRVGVNPAGSPLSIYWALPAEDRAYFNSFSQAKTNNERKRILEMIPADQRHLYQSLWSRIDSGDATLINSDNSQNGQYIDDRRQGVMSGMAGQPMPAADWIGWHEDVDMSDVQVRYVDRIGADLHDYGLWESDLRKSEGQPFLQGSEDYLFQGKSLRFSSMRSEVYNMLGSGINPASLAFPVIPGSSAYANIQYNDHRDNEISTTLTRYINNGY